MKSIENYRIEMTSGYSFWTFLSFLSRFARAIAENEAMPNLFMIFNPIWKIESENDLNVLCVCVWRYGSKYELSIVIVCGLRNWHGKIEFIIK